MVFKSAKTRSRGAKGKTTEQISLVKKGASKKPKEVSRKASLRDGRGSRGVGRSRGEDRGVALDAGEILEMRALLWSNVLRETLSALCAESARADRDAREEEEGGTARRRSEEGLAGVVGERGGEERGGRAGSSSSSSTSSNPGELERGRPEGGRDRHGPGTLLDGHLALVTGTGERIQIAGIRPAIEFGMAADAEQRRICMAVDGTVFHVRTPAGDVFTLPIHEIRSIHGLNESIMRQLHEAAMEERENPPPFGFAAFRGLTPGRREEQPQHIPATPIDPGA